MKSIDGIKFAEMVKLGAHHLYENADYVDSSECIPGSGWRYRNEYEFIDDIRCKGN